MMMKILNTHIPTKILEARNKRITADDILESVRQILDKDEQRERNIQRTLSEGSDLSNNEFNIDLLSSEKIFHISDIKKICVLYRLRFLDSNYFKGALPYEALIKIKELENNHHIELKGFKIMAPSKLFKLENADDPLLFAPIGNDYFYLIHSWGKDLHPFRKLLMWPFKEVENLLITLALFSVVLTLMVPDGLFSPHTTTSEYIMTFFFIFKGVAGMTIFYGFKKGKNFSSSIWNSKYYNA